MIEAKFTDALVDRDGKTTIATGYLYQLYAYLASQTGRGDDTLDAAEGVLLFVKTVDRDVFDGEVTIQVTASAFYQSTWLDHRPTSARWMQRIQD